jgi:hypothetical protein
MKFACELIHKATGESKVVVVQLSEAEAADARAQNGPMGPCARAYALRQAAQIAPDLMWDGHGAIAVLQ